MKVIIFGATGTVGSLMVEKALSQGHSVTAFARKTSALISTHEALTRHAGDVLDHEAVSDAVQGHDAVLIVLGAGRKGTVRSEGTRNILEAMEKHDVRRLICQSTLGAGDSHPLLNFFWKRIMFGLLLRPAFADHQAQEISVKNSNLDWTIVRPAAFTDGPSTNSYKHGFPATQRKLSLKISRSDVADFMLKQLTDNRYLRQTPGLSY